MKIELYRAGAQRTAKYNHHDVPIDVGAPERPQLVVAFELPDHPGTTCALGRYRIFTAGDVHRSWTAATATGADEDRQLSRDQVLLSRGDQRWEISVPGAAGAKHSVILQYWASSATRELPAGGGPIGLDPGGRVSAVVQTATNFYWALLAVPSVEFVAGLGDRHPNSGRTTDTLIGSSPTAPRPLPDRWEEAVHVKFGQYLTWPMAWRPKPAQPKDFPEPPDWFIRQLRDGGKDPQTRYADWVRRTLRVTKASAVSRGFRTTDANGLDVSLVEWLAMSGDLRFDDHRLPPRAG